ncbi:LOW QUALITY PROTEIN: structure-specific endonuclease subunit SLX1 homolog [Phlebotomus argentipes]|uniref:LOW QUALITY PROTEIN: structure-specific endonuclease subunit SLX1 homolog n=1 Tax=Phlebotomus argentipes TaxID=94469 RepID=UPI002892F268|nr:LOW QUALITY PROTEIN: structure-specific endonuclease subunit SLX1 homolog [Phlebotomus argentipes]
MQVTAVEDFHGVYLLVSRSENRSFCGRTYVGYTVDPNRRISQHNRGKDGGGAKRTNARGPWQMVLIVHGFPNSLSALRFEWAWQKPEISRRLKNIPGLGKKSSLRRFDLQFRILTEMLRIGPWSRLPLVIRWLADDFVRDFPASEQSLDINSCNCHALLSSLLFSGTARKDATSSHGVCFGRVKRKKKPEKAAEEHPDDGPSCSLCASRIGNPCQSLLTCINPRCTLQCHIICLARVCITEANQYIPTEGDCPICFTHFLWGDLIRKKNGCSDLVPTSDDATDMENNSHDLSLDSTSDGDSADDS